MARKRPRAINPEERENQMIALAVDLAEKQLMEGTASAQVLTHYLKLATTREKLEKEKLIRENRLLDVKAESYDRSSHIDELYENAIAAMRRYQGNNGDD